MAEPKTMFQKVCAFHNTTTSMALAIPDDQRRSKEALEVLKAFQTATDLKDAVIAHGDVMAIIRATKPFYEGEEDNPMVRERLDRLWARYRETLATIRDGMAEADAWLSLQGLGTPFAYYLESDRRIDRHCARTQAELNGESFTRTHKGYLDMEF